MEALDLHCQTSLAIGSLPGIVVPQESDLCLTIDSNCRVDYFTTYKFPISAGARTWTVEAARKRVAGSQRRADAFGQRTDVRPADGPPANSPGEWPLHFAHSRWCAEMQEALLWGGASAEQRTVHALHSCVRRRTSGSPANAATRKNAGRKAGAGCTGPVTFPPTLGIASHAAVGANVFHAA